jgi:hypothetical protein
MNFFWLAYRREGPISGVTSLREITRMVLAKFQYCHKKGKLAFKIVGIGQASVSHSYRPNAHNSITEKGSYHQYLAKSRRW